MAMRRAVVALSLGLVATAPVRAEDEVTGTALATCMDKSNGVTAAMLDCDRAESKRQDKRLNRAYQKLMASGTAVQQEALRDSQRAWLAYRNGTCKLHRTFGGGGTLDSVSASGCDVDVLTRRAKFLEDLAGETE